MLTRVEASDDGYITKIGTTYSVTDYVVEGGKYSINVYFSSAGIEKRGFKRFIMDLGGVTITTATLYWYLVSVDNDGGNTNCKLEQINDYGILDANATEFTGTVKHDYGDVMTPSSTAGWYSQDVSAEMEASKADGYVAFRWRVKSQPATDDIDYFIGSYDSISYKAYLEITYTTGWQHEVDSVAPAGTAKINGLVRATGIAKVNGE